MIVLPAEHYTSLNVYFSESFLHLKFEGVLYWGCVVFFVLGMVLLA